MRRTRLNLLLLAGILVAVGGWFLFGGAGGPKYEGKSVAYWFKAFYQASHHPRRTRFRPASKPLDALRQMGTNAVPYLLDRAMNAEKDTAVRKAFFDFLELLPESWHAPGYVSKEQIRESAIQALREIKPPAALVLPRLARALTEPKSPPSDRAISVLETVGEGRETLIPHFAAALQATNQNTRLAAAWFIEEMGPKAASAVPDLIRVLRTTERPNTSFLEAAFALGRIGSQAAPALPLLTQAWETETDVYQRFSLAMVLCLIEPLQREPFAMLVNALTNQPSSVVEVRDAAWRLGLLGTNAADAIPALLQAAERTKGNVLLIARSFKEIGAPPSLLLPAARAGLQSGEGKYRVELAAWMVGISPGDPQAQAALVSEITNHGKFERESIAALGSAGTNAQGLASVILEAFNGTNVRAWTSVPAALKRLGVSPGPSLAKLREKLKTTNDQGRLAIAGTILEVEPGDEPARLALMGLIQAKSKQECGAIYFLGKAGPASSNALPLLRQELKSEDLDVRDAAATAIEQIEAKRPPVAGR